MRHIFFYLFLAISWMACESKTIPENKEPVTEETSTPTTGPEVPLSESSPSSSTLSVAETKTVLGYNMEALQFVRAQVLTLKDLKVRAASDQAQVASCDVTRYYNNDGRVFAYEMDCNEGLWSVYVKQTDSSEMPKVIFAEYQDLSTSAETAAVFEFYKLDPEYGPVIVLTKEGQLLQGDAAVEKMAAYQEMLGMLAS